MLRAIEGIVADSVAGDKKLLDIPKPRPASCICSECYI
jgi:hypothetical protein